MATFEAMRRLFSILLCAATTLHLATCVLGTRPAIELRPNHSEHRVGSGQPFVLRCFVARLSQGAAFSWSGPALSDGSRTSISEDNSGTMSTLTISSVEEEDGGQYSCSYPGQGSTSTTVTVVSASQVSFLTVATTQEFPEGSDAVVLCPAVYGEPQLNMLWTKGYGAINDSRFTAERGQLRIQNIASEDSGSYECFLSDGSPSITHDRIQVITVKVVPRSEYAPKINDSIRRIEMTYGDDLYLPCELEELKENVTYSWTINTDFERDHLIDTRASLHRRSEEFLGGIYTCRVENNYGSDVVDFVVKIVAPPLPAMCSLLIKTTATGTTVVLKYCDLTSPVELSDLSFEWSKRNEREEFVDVSLGERISINHNGWLTIKDLESADLGVYRVNISNEMDYSIHTVQLELPASTTTQNTPQAQVGNVLVNMQFEIYSDSMTCSDIKETSQNWIEQHLLEEFDVSEVALEGVVITCPLNSAKAGTFTVNLRGSGAGQLATLLRERATSVVTLSNGRTLTLTVCTNECSVEATESTVSTKPISNAAGVIIAVTFICVVLAGVVLLVVILIRYRRRSLVKEIDTEQVLPLQTAGQDKVDYFTVTENQLKKKPLFGRSVSVSFPVSR